MKFKLAALGLVVIASTLAQSPVPTTSVSAKHPFTFEDMMKLKRVGAPVASPDRKWVLVVEMVNDHRWKQCRVAPTDGSSPGYNIGPSGGGCTFAAWTPDGKWMYYNSNAVGGIVSGSSSALQGIEASFHQDLNGDGIILLSGSGSIIGTNSLVVGSGASAESAAGGGEM